jgi:hypothetical protein
MSQGVPIAVIATREEEILYMKERAEREATSSVAVP